VTLSLTRRLALVDEQSALLQAAAAQTDLAAPVPSCPEWTVRDLVAHHGNVLRGWAAVIGSGADEQPAWMADDGGSGPWEPMGGDWQPWYAASRAALRSAVTQAGDAAPAWSWWRHVAPATAGAIARHQVQEACVHRWDAQLAAGLRPDPLPADAAADGVAEFLTICLPAEPWPWDGPPSTVAIAPDGEPRWLLVSDGTITARPQTDDDLPDATVTGSASDVVLMFYERIAPRDLTVTGDAALVTRLLG
jgi:uncharacterized protein (TIGR03083 family)